MNKLNKKGFTLIEMLVVIAIIAVLVAIIIPTISSATTKANAAADDANLRSMLAEASTDFLGGAEDKTGMLYYTAPTGGAACGTFDTQGNAPTGKSKEVKDKPVKIVYNDATKALDAYFEVGKETKYNIDYFAYIAEHGQAKGA